MGDYAWLNSNVEELSDEEEEALAEAMQDVALDDDGAGSARKTPVGEDAPEAREIRSGDEASIQRLSDLL